MCIVYSILGIYWDNGKENRNFSYSVFFDVESLSHVQDMQLVQSAPDCPILRGTHGVAPGYIGNLHGNIRGEGGMVFNIGII